MKFSVGASLLAFLLFGCHRTESSAPEPVASTRITAATPTVPPVIDPAAQPAAAAIAPKTGTKSFLVETSERNAVAVCRGDDFTLTVPARPGSDLRLTKYDGLAKPRQVFAESALGPNIGAEKYTFSTKSVPETKKSLVIELVDQEPPKEHTTVKVDLVLCN